MPYLANTKVKGRLIVIEGPDASGRSTQITMLTSKLEADGHAVLNTGLRRSELISQGPLLQYYNSKVVRKPTKPELPHIIKKDIGIRWLNFVF